MKPLRGRTRRGRPGRPRRVAVAALVLYAATRRARVPRTLGDPTPPAVLLPPPALDAADGRPPPRPSGRRRLTTRPGRLELAGVGLFAAAWALFVGDGSQAAFVVALACAAAVSASLAWSRSWLALVLVIAIATIVGTEARGELGGGTAPLGSFRLLDGALLAAVGGIAARTIVERGFEGAVRAAIPRWKAISLEAWIVLATTGWAVALWIGHGAARNPLVRTDVRLILLAVGTYVLAIAVLPGNWTRFTYLLVGLAPLLALKASLIYATNHFSIGTFDRVQAALVETPERRVLLVGGDTLLILTPAIATALAFGSDSRNVRWLCAVGATAAMAGTLLSGTRTSLLVSVGMVVTAVALCAPRGGRVTRRSVVAAAVVLLGLIAGAYATGLAGRLTAQDAPHVGINFRADEIRTASQLPRSQLILGQGLGGSFISKDTNGAPVQSGWSHVLPVWIILKTGLLGLIALLAVLGLLSRRAVRAIRERRPGPHLITAPFVGALVVGGLIAMSLTIDRLPQPEGAMLVAVGAVLLARAAPTTGP